MTGSEPVRGRYVVVTGASSGIGRAVAERLPEEVLARGHMALENVVARPGDVADAVAYVAGLPLRLSIPALGVRPAQTATFS